jgi:hypothetical protein
MPKISLFTAQRCQDGELAMVKDKDRKPRNDYIYGTTKIEVSQLEVAIEPSGEISFGNDMINVYSERSYDRIKGPKVLSRIPQDGPSLTFSQDVALKSYEFICAVDTNTRVIGDKRVSVVGILTVTPEPVSLPEGSGTFWKFDVPFCLEYIGLKVAPENFGWITAWEHLLQNGMIKAKTNVGMIVDSDLANINSYNQRKKPVFESIHLPQSVRLLYASSDAGKENIVNKSLSTADSISTQALRALETGAAPFNEELRESPWFERYRVIWPRNKTRTPWICI